MIKPIHWLCTAFVAINLIVLAKDIIGAKIDNMLEGFGKDLRF